MPGLLPLLLVTRGGIQEWQEGGFHALGADAATSRSGGGGEAAAASGGAGAAPHLLPPRECAAIAAIL